MSKRVKAAAETVAVPRDRAEADSFLARIGAAMRERQLIEAAAEEEVDAVKRRAEEEARPHAEAVSTLTRGLQIWAEANREALCVGGRKTVTLASGELGWRLRPPSVRIRSLGDAVAAIKALNLTRFLRVREEVNKEAMLAEPNVAAQIAGISVGSAGEDFFAAPIEITTTGTGDRT
jgi:phage host-nuclease inhibitor protein Gam